MVETNRRFPASYNASRLGALQSFCDDTKLVFRLLCFLPGLFFPLRLFCSDEFDELSLSYENLRDIFFHLVIFMFQLAFLMTLPFCLVIFSIPYIAAFHWMNGILCMLMLNGKDRSISPTINMSKFSDHENESWVFINGIGVGYAIDILHDTIVL